MTHNIGMSYPATGPDAAVRSIEGGSTTEGICGAGAVILAILALLGVLPLTLVSIATIAVGVAMVVGGGAVLAKYNRLVALRPSEQHEISGGLGLEVLGGIAGIVLGILALLGIGNLMLLSIAAIVLGAALLLSSGSLAQLDNALRVRSLEPGSSATHGAVVTASGAEVLVGLGAIVLGILGLAGINPFLLATIAMLALGAATLFSGTSFASRIGTLFG
ncbi:MAG TPA: hypothetical protein VFW66_03510 [Gemmatimonadales bacterium]|nr:hypothetical protein [Gemmatimonadales bacterium]